MEYITNAYVSMFHANGLCKSFMYIRLEDHVVFTSLLMQLEGSICCLFS